jgi:hypothetical protein
VLLVGDQIAGQRLGAGEGRTDEAEASQTALEAVVVHLRFAKDVGQRPVGHVKPHQKQHRGQGFGLATHVGQDKRGSQREALTGSLEANPSLAQSEFGRDFGEAVEDIAVLDLFGKDLLVSGQDVVEVGAGKGAIMEKVGVWGLIYGKTDRFIAVESFFL